MKAEVPHLAPTADVALAARGKLSAREILSWPPTIDVALAGRALGISRTHAYTLVREDSFPIRVIRAGHAYRVVTADLLRALGLDSLDGLGVTGQA